MSRAGKWLNRLVILITTVFLLCFLGCMMAQDLVTPCYIDPAAAEYAKLPTKSINPLYTTLWDAKRIQLHMDYQHQLIQIDLMRQLQDDDLQVDFIRDAHLTHIEAAEEFQKTMFSADSLPSLLVTGLGFGTLGALTIKRPGDKSAKQIKAENGNGKVTT